MRSLRRFRQDFFGTSKSAYKERKECLRSGKRSNESFATHQQCSAAMILVLVRGAFRGFSIREVRD